jgi:hypothetical protein
MSVVLAQAAEGLTGNVTLGLAMIGGGLALGGGKSSIDHFKSSTLS